MEFYRLSEICTLKQWKTLTAEDLEPDGVFDVYGANGIIGKSNSFNHEEPTVIVGCRGSCGAYTVRLTSGKCYINGNAMCFDNLSEKINPKYLMYFLKSLDYSKIITGVAQPQITGKQLEKVVRVPKISIVEQDKIVKQLETIEDIMLADEKEINLFKESAASLFMEMFGDPIVNNKQLPVKKLKDLSIKITNGNTPKGGQQVYLQSGIMFIRSQNVWNNKMVLDDVAYIDERTNDCLKESILKNGDILITKTGRYNTENSSLGRSAIYNGPDYGANINGHVYMVRLKESVNKHFVLRILISDQYKEYIRKVCVGGTDKRQLNKNHIEDFPIVLPPLSEQNKYADYCIKTDLIIERIESHRNSFEELFEQKIVECFGVNY